MPPARRVRIARRPSSLSVYHPHAVESMTSAHHSRPDHTSAGKTGTRRAWCAPRLVVHASLTTLTQSMAGLDAVLLLQIGTSGGGIGGGPDRVQQHPAINPNSSQPSKPASF